ncbi:16S rRNA (adenine(1518)-N(6)/adenine(1519)-N(6))-dimethyltransferase RsmA [Methylophilus medardicus]|uniref:Ribosomal RNA small subunit methyltransferase A n=1 Tax=Methylophilus medardicus TaxID=2588534 RepID=A0A5B8CTB8_9PROT|nr:16S rRNA (adenine(1518)-N(6)/adenine(1519)-N(6))-dimethyltransferase RsmA [Methylophilus medardicus]QDC44547.1 16S rRNA (adenine(1518)-N(6)/adenine(1519)-N(6))-dimethyltransferase RsmA [Methylophilus medardicus]QDC49554.1 16S rRNA (adenine(1518)-N(6)/adenine(1519)-N(6))-dimethyltransferase RsmA [Methylophilus medardicus]QDC53259.1 16S rRNA (adenine(1518)-N(6)/adenine(1519)-N(6))-dimethyltransferase RsmA [Methylophilus medardicus]
MKHIAKKKFGQNFLIDQAIIQSLINAIHPQADDLMVEIGPGLGAMTQPLIKHLDHLHVVEIDRDIIQWMQSFYPPQKITIHNSDVLKFDFSHIGERIRVVGNLPYNISSPILFKLLENTAQIIDMHFMLQKEVVERMVAAPSTSEYGRLSVMLQYRLHMEYMVTVPPEAFDPAPKVESAFVRCVPHARLPYPAADEALFAKVVTAAFGQRRKTLRNTLKGLLDDAGFSAINIDSQSRAENLGVAEFVAISNYLSAHT